MKNAGLDSLLDPQSVAVVGASPNPSKLGHAILANLVDGGFPGRLYAVNRSGDDVRNCRGYSSVANIPDPVDLAVLAVPAPVVAEMVEQCGAAGVRGVIVIAAGFQETGPRGAAREAEIAGLAERHGMRLLGPNCLGIVDTHRRLNASFAGSMPPAGRISVVSQSGAMCTAILDWAKANGQGFASFVSVGNKADLTENDFLARWADDLETDVVLAYLEGISDGPEFLEVAASLTRRKPLVMIKAGVSDEGAAAVSSHTGSLTGSEDALEVALRRAGVTRARSIEELFDFTTVFAPGNLPAGPRTAIITNAGGPGVITTDAVAGTGLELAPLADQTAATLGKLLPAEANLHNPVDLIGDARAARYQTALSTVLGDKGVDSAVVLLTPQSMTEIPQTAEVIIRCAQASGKPVVASFIGGAAVAEGAEKLRQAAVPAYDTPDRAVRALAALTEYAAYRARPRRKPPKGQRPKRTSGHALKHAAATGRTALTGAEAGKVVEPYGIEVPKILPAADVAVAAKVAGRVGFPAVMKIDSPDILHKSDVGGVAVGLADAAAVTEAYGALLKRVRKQAPEASLTGVTLERHLPDGLDLIVGAKRDPTFGPVALFGSGGIYVEVFKDVSYGLAPLSDAEADAMIDRVKGSALLAGARGRKKFDRKAVRQALVAVSRIAADFPMIAEIELNPLRAFPKGAISLDTRIILTNR